MSDDRLVHIVDYQDRWPREFGEISANIRGSLGDLALRIDHIGSTAVPDLGAKDIIDVQVTVATFAGFSPIAEGLESLGYVRREE
ncbi:MAG: GrpB family protein, partial [Candidatus Poribacteria bacterium]